MMKKITHWIYCLPQLVKETILDHLSPMEFLSLGSASKGTKELTQGDNPRTPSSQATKGCKRFTLKMDRFNYYESGLAERFPHANLKQLICSFYIRMNDKNDDPNDPIALELLIEKYGSKIRKLSMDYAEVELPPVWDFFDSCLNIKGREISLLYSTGSNPPSCFRNLKSLKVKNTRLINRLRDAMNLCPEVEVFQIPWTFHEDFLKHLISWMREREENGEKLEFIDLGEEPRVGKECLASLFEICDAKNVKVLNVKESYFEHLTVEMTPPTGQVIQSVRLTGGFSVQRFLAADLVNLESIKMDVKMYPRDLFCYVGEYSCKKVDEWNPEVRPLGGNWPNLKSIHLKWEEERNPWYDDDDYTGSNLIPWWAEATAFLHLLLNKEKRPTLKNLSLTFKKELKDYKIFRDPCSGEYGYEDVVGGDGIAKCFVPSTLISLPVLASNFKNLSSLSIVGLDADEEDFVHLWVGLPLLETLEIGRCSTLGDFGFIGDLAVFKKPAFLNLKKLWKLTLDLGGMERVSDRFLKDVLHNMPLKQLFLRGHNLTQVTREGILSLVGGTFSRTIQYFPFDYEWSLKDVEGRKFLELGDQFRSLC